jgi:hypothetical protein
VKVAEHHGVCQGLQFVKGFRQHGERVSSHFILNVENVEFSARAFRFILRWCGTHTCYLLVTYFRGDNPTYGNAVTNSHDSVSHAPKSILSRHHSIHLPGSCSLFNALGMPSTYLRTCTVLLRFVQHALPPPIFASGMQDNAHGCVSCGGNCL